MISVCAPYWNRPEAVRSMLAMYRRLYPALELEFSICDDGSPRPLTLAGQSDCVVTRLRRKTYPLNPCVPINRAVAASLGNMIVLTNPETVHYGPVLVELLDLVQHEDDYATAPCYGTGYGSSPMWLAGPEVNYRTGGRLPVPPGAHFHFLAVLHRRLWDRAGGFDEEYRNGTACDDNDWLWRLQAVGACFKTGTSAVSQPKGTSDWKLPFNGPLFYSKWPQARVLA